jgi:hypothetical protein
MVTRAEEIKQKLETGEHKKKKVKPITRLSGFNCQYNII